jgi:hypothetical protein
MKIDEINIKDKVLRDYFFPFFASAIISLFQPSAVSSRSAIKLGLVVDEDSFALGSGFGAALIFVVVFAMIFSLVLRGFFLASHESYSSGF